MSAGSQPSYRRNRRRGWRPVCELLEARRLLASIAGNVFLDSNSDGKADLGEPGMPGVVVYLDSNANGTLDQNGFKFEPDDYVEQQVLNHAQKGSVVASATAADNQPAFLVVARPDPHASTGKLVFGQRDTGIWGPTRRLRFDFTSPVSSVSLAVVGATVASSDVRLDAFTVDGSPLAQAEILRLRNATRDRLNVSRPVPDIGYVVAYTTSHDGRVRFDNLRVNDEGSETATVTGANGFYRFDNVPWGTSLVAQQVPMGYQQTSPFPSTGYQTQVRSSVVNLRFGNHTASLGGTAFTDRGKIGTYEPGSLDSPLEGMGLYLDLNRNGLADTRTLSIETSNFAKDEVLDLAVPGVKLSVVDSGGEPVSELVRARDSDQQEGRFFAHGTHTSWKGDRRLHAEFESPARFVELDFLAVTDGSRGVLEAFHADGKPLLAVTTGPLESGQRRTLKIARSGHDIGSVVAYASGVAEAAGRIDKLVATTVDEPVVITAEDGSYEFSQLSAGSYRIAPLEVPGRILSLPEEAYDQEVSFGKSILDLDFGTLLTNKTPHASEDSTETPEDTAITIDVLANDEDPDGLLNPATVEIVSEPLEGTAHVNIDGQIAYTPSQNFHGVDTLEYVVRDDLATTSDVTLVTIRVSSVNDAPLTETDVATVSANASVVIEVLNNDADVDGELAAESLTITRAPTKGIAKADPVTGTVLYTPNAAARGTDTFQYSIADDQGLASEAEVRVDIVSDDLPPLAQPDAVATLEGTPITIPLLANDIPGAAVLDPSTLRITSPPSHGTATVDPTTGTVTYLPNLGFVGADKLQYVVHDQQGRASDGALVEISVVERPFPHQNPVDPFDINGDGQVVPLDALLIINELNSRSVSDPVTGRILVNPVPPMRPAGYFDVSGDGFVTSGDALRVINALNAAPAMRSGAEGEPLDTRAVAAALADPMFSGEQSKIRHRTTRI